MFSASLETSCYEHTSNETQKDISQCAIKAVQTCQQRQPSLEKEKARRFRKTGTLDCGQQAIVTRRDHERRKNTATGTRKKKNCSPDGIRGRRMAVFSSSVKVRSSCRYETSRRRPLLGASRLPTKLNYPVAFGRLR